MVGGERPRYSVVLTSCGRFDLLRESIASLLDHLDWPPERFVVTEDTGDPAVRGVLAHFDAPFDLVLNETHLGQMRSIDRGYARVSSPYVFHMEDDWEFLRRGFLEESVRVLEADPAVSMVGLREKLAMNPRLHHQPDEDLAGVTIFRDRDLHPEYGGHSFNPGLRRLADIRALMPLAERGYELDISLAFKARGQHMVHLAEPACRHIGEGRHVDDPTQPLRPKTFWQRLVRSAEKRWNRMTRSGA